MANNVFCLKKISSHSATFNSSQESQTQKTQSKRTEGDDLKKRTQTVHEPMDQITHFDLIPAKARVTSWSGSDGVSESNCSRLFIVQSQILTW
ncbi:hypothetical protein G6F57_003775 [Rhizopus arrhizus]|uniref:Uncharacterized protein n=1 Tax=Rhizopus oryzae TaxID=64495 RepID=A0A9P6X9L1_RHIOR|nr:hypothetical protein G6F23_001802 [Rhizopus arrhizus]KAG1425731.1 hypothetical protein G6F58_001796 [Rhizopus delemar]KAG0766216.1 hypothetical protein G6F24_003784 [Rhizopus arrhizus]KAG0789865.1 hypothetical protein G6F21_006216 [Rhizopus arrhizus]KAG0799999.1 hypothetical protein G6F22_002669 [Rhizopus arrhizus]